MKRDVIRNWLYVDDVNLYKGNAACSKQYSHDWTSASFQNAINILHAKSISNPKRNKQ